MPNRSLSTRKFTVGGRSVRWSQMGLAACAFSAAIDRHSMLSHRAGLHRIGLDSSDAPEDETRGEDDWMAKRCFP